MRLNHKKRYRSLHLTRTGTRTRNETVLYLIHTISAEHCTNLSPVFICSTEKHPKLKDLDFGCFPPSDVPRTSNSATPLCPFSRLWGLPRAPKRSLWSTIRLPNCCTACCSVPLFDQLWHPEQILFRHC